MRYGVMLLLCWLGWVANSTAAQEATPWPQPVYYQCGVTDIFVAGQASTEGWRLAAGAQVPVQYDGQACWIRLAPLPHEGAPVLERPWLALGDLNVHRLDIELWDAQGRRVLLAQRVGQHPATIASGRRLLFIPDARDQGTHYLRYTPVPGSSAIPGMGRHLLVMAADPAQMLRSEQRFDAMSIGAATFMASSALIIGFFALVLRNVSYGLFTLYALTHAALILSKNGLQFLLPELGRPLINPHLFQYVVATLSMALSLYFGEFMRHSRRLAWLGRGVALAFLLLILLHAISPSPPELLIAVIVPVHFLVLLSGHWRGWRSGVRSSGILLWGMIPIAIYWMLYLWFALVVKAPQPDWMQIGSAVEYLRTLCLPLAFLYALADHAVRQQRDKDHLSTQLADSRRELERRIMAATTELRAKKEEAENATLAKSRFLAAASHDLRQPTHALGMFVARLSQLPADAQTRELVGKLESAVRAMQDLLDGMLDLSRLETQATPVQSRPVAVNALFESVQRHVASAAAAKGLRLRIHPTRYWVMSDALLLQRILLNLVSNAIQYTPQGTVLLTCRPTDQGRRVRIEVRDSGIGIAPEHHALIFKEFYQVGNSERDRARGMGLGLTLVERSARLLGHVLVMRSCVGQGSCFRLDLQLSPPTAVADTSMSEHAMTGSLQGLRLLVVEDDAMAREALSGLLTSWGCVVVSARGLQSALDLLAGQGPDDLPSMILSDYRLPGGENGIQVIEALRESSGTPLAACLMSGDTDGQLINRARDAGLPLLTKPVRPAKLRNLLMRHQRQARR